jgi:hypothetical protein
MMKHLIRIAILAVAVAVLFRTVELYAWIWQ